MKEIVVVHAGCFAVPCPVCLAVHAFPSIPHRGVRVACRCGENLVVETVLLIERGWSDPEPKGNAVAVSPVEVEKEKGE